jgi:hypothetical protein
MPDQDTTKAQDSAAGRQRAEQEATAAAPHPGFPDDLAAAGQQEAERAKINQDPGYLASTQADAPPAGSDPADSGTT